jgi:hypothetical protein
LAFDAPSEWTFVRDLEKFYNSPSGQAAIGQRSLYLLRNADREDKGLGFALAGSFYPDFLLWLVDDVTGQQWLTFVDPKGLMHLDLSHPKLGLYKEIKSIEAELEKNAKPGEAKLILNAFVLSHTAYSELLNVDATLTKGVLEERHVMFMEDGSDMYLTKMFERIN